MWQYIVTFISSLAVAWVAIRWSARNTDKRVLYRLKREISDNITMCQIIHDHLDEELKLLKEGKVRIYPLTPLETSAWNAASWTTSFSDESLSMAFHGAYAVVRIVNSFINRIEELKYGPVTVLAKNLNDVRQDNYIGLKTYVESAARVALEKAKKVIDYELSTYKWWRLW